MPSAGVLVKAVETGVRGFVPLTQLSYNMAAETFSGVSDREKQWRADNPGEWPLTSPFGAPSPDLLNPLSERASTQ